MKTTRRGFFGLLAGFLAAPRAKSFFGGLIPGHNYQVATLRPFAPPRRFHPEFAGADDEGYYYGFMHPFVLRDLVGCGPMPAAARSVKNRKRNKARQAYLLDRARDNSQLVDILKVAA